MINTIVVFWCNLSAKRLLKPLLKPECNSWHLEFQNFLGETPGIAMPEVQKPFFTLSHKDTTITIIGTVLHHLYYMAKSHKD